MILIKEKISSLDKGEKAKHILDAHKTLMSLSEENEKVFKNVVELLEKDIKK